MEEMDLVPAQLYNADESGLYWRCLHDKTLSSGDEKEAPGMKKQKARVTLMFCPNAEGTHKISLLIIGKFQNSRCFKGVYGDRLACTYTAQKSAWMNAFIMNFSSPSAPSHPASEDIIYNTKDGQITVLYLSPNTTSILQTMDQGPIEATQRL